MGAMSDDLENKIINGTLRNSAYTPIATLYVALFDASSSLALLEAGTLTGEIHLGGYARQTVTFIAPTDGATSNTAEVSWGPVSADWDDGNGDVTYVAIMSALTAGLVLYYGALTTAKTVTNGDTFKFNIGDLAISID
jgi:hypothetical protein